MSIAECFLLFLFSFLYLDFLSLSLCPSLSLSVYFSFSLSPCITDCEKSEWKLDTLVDLWDCINVTQCIVYCNNDRTITWLQNSITNRDFTVASVKNHDICLRIRWYCSLLSLPPRSRSLLFSFSTLASVVYFFCVVQLHLYDISLIISMIITTFLSLCSDYKRHDSKRKGASAKGVSHRQLSRAGDRRFLSHTKNRCCSNIIRFVKSK